jgi:hypothetical protein
MEACLRTSHVSSDDTSLYDSRYFYVREKLGYYTCGIAAETMLFLLRNYRFESFQQPPWRDVTTKVNSPFLKSLIEKQISLCAISRDGLSTVSKDLTKIDTVAFLDSTIRKVPIMNRRECRLYLPRSFGFPYFDAAILHVNSQSKEAQVFAIQVDLDPVPREYEKDFYEEMWPEWRKALEQRGFTAKSTFVRVGKTISASEIVE